MNSNCESGSELLARLGKKIDISSFDPVLFPSGVEQPAVYEFFGKEGTGKTQTLLHIIAKCILPSQWNSSEIGGQGVKVIFIDTDYHFNMVRLAALLECSLKQTLCTSEQSDDEIEKIIKSSFNRLHVVRCNSSSELLLTLHSLQPLVGSQSDVCVLVIDSISAFYWIDRSMASDNSSVQDVHMTKICDILCNIVKKYKLTVFVSKYALFEKRIKSHNEENLSLKYEKSHELKVQHNEYLGRAWNKLVSHRLLFQKHSNSQGTLQFQIDYDIGFPSKVNESLQFKIKEGGLAFI